MRRATIKTAAVYKMEAALPARHLVGLFRACVCSPPPGGQFRRTNNRAGQANAGARPISPPSLASSRPDRSIPAVRKPERLCPIISPALICEPPKWESSIGRVSQATVTGRRLVRVSRSPWRSLRPVDQVSWEVNRGRPADQAPGPVYLLLSVLSPRARSLPLEKQPRQ